MRGLAHAGHTIKRSREYTTQIRKGDAARRSEGADIGKDFESRIVSDGKDSVGLSRGNILLYGRQQERGISPQVSCGNDFMASVTVVGDRKVASPLIKSLPILRPTRQELELMRLRPEADAERRHFQPWSLSVLKTNVTAAIPKRILKYYSGNRPLMRKVDPIIRAVDRTVDHVLRIRKREAGKDLFADVSFAAPRRIFEKPHVGSGGHQHTSLPAHHAIRHDNVVRKHSAAIRYSIAVCVFKQHNAAYRSGIHWIASIFGHVQASVLVPIHGHGTVDHRLGGKKFNAKALVNVDHSESIARAVGRHELPARPHKETEYKDDNCQQ